MRINLSREQLNTLTSSLRVDILNAVESKREAKEPSAIAYWSTLITELKEVRAHLISESTICGS